MHIFNYILYYKARAAVLDELTEFFRAELLDILVGVLGSLHLQDADVQPHLGEDAHGAVGGSLSCLVGVVGQNDLLGVFGQHPRLLVGERRTQRGHGILKTGGVKGDHVDVALAEDELLGAMVLGKVQREQIPSLLEGGGVRAVDVLAVILSAYVAPREGDDVARVVDDGEHHAVAEHIEGSSRLLADATEEGFLHLLVGESVLTKHGGQGAEIVGGVPQAEAADDGHGQASLLGEVFHTRLTDHGVEQAIPPKPRGDEVHLKDPLAGHALFLLVAVGGKLHTAPFGQKLHRTGVIQILHPHDEGEGVSSRLAAEAEEGLVIGEHRKGGCFLAMEGAEAAVIGARPLQGDVGADQIHNIRPILDRLHNFSWISTHSCKPLHTLGTNRSWYASMA